MSFMYLESGLGCTTPQIPMSFQHQTVQEMLGYVSYSRSCS